MAKASIECECPECGATHYYEKVCHNRREAENWEAYHAGEATTRLCPECYRKAAAARREQEREAENAAAAERAAELNLPALTGSEKQVAWATTIRQQALDSALELLVGQTSAALNEQGTPFIAGVMSRFPTEAKWWIDNRDGVSHRLGLEIECANWARLPEDKRNEKMSEVERNATTGNLGRSILRQYRTMEAARISGRTYAEQYEADKAAAEAAKRAALPPVPAKLAERLGKPGARWNGKFYGRDGLRVYLNGDEVIVPAEVKAAWEREWDAYNAAKKAAGIG